MTRVARGNRISSKHQEQRQIVSTFFIQAVSLLLNSYTSVVILTSVTYKRSAIEIALIISVRLSVCQWRDASTVNKKLLQNLFHRQARDLPRLWIKNTKKNSQPFPRACYVEGWGGIKIAIFDQYLASSRKQRT